MRQQIRIGAIPTDRAKQVQGTKVGRKQLMARRNEVRLVRPETPMGLDSVKSVQFLQSAQKTRYVLRLARMNDI